MMPHNLDLIFTLTGALVTALAFGLLSRRLGLSPIIGYMVAGIFLGRHAAWTLDRGGVCGHACDDHFTAQRSESGHLQKVASGVLPRERGSLP